MAHFKKRQCKNPDCSNEFNQYNSLQSYCSPACQLAHKKPIKIKRESEKHKAQKIVYDKLRELFLKRPENSICFIEGCNKVATTIEHRAGRIGSNYLNTTTWAGCCWEHNTELENNPELSHEYQLSKLHNGKKGDLK